MHKQEKMTEESVVMIILGTIFVIWFGWQIYKSMLGN